MGTELLWAVCGSPDRAMGVGWAEGARAQLAKAAGKEPFARLTGHMISLIEVERAYSSLICDKAVAWAMKSHSVFAPFK